MNKDIKLRTRQTKPHNSIINNKNKTITTTIKKHNNDNNIEKRKKNTPSIAYLLDRGLPVVPISVLHHRHHAGPLDAAGRHVDDIALPCLDIEHVRHDLDDEGRALGVVALPRDSDHDLA
jgi:hypothetical protein